MKAAEETLRDEYRRRFDTAAEYRRQVWQVLCRDFFARFIPADSTLLDVGCGWGEFVNQIPAAKRYAMDLNPDAPGRLSEGVEFLHQDCSEPWPLPPASLDIVFSSNFLEHLPSKHHVEATLAHALRALKPGGRVILLGPNVRLVPGSYWDFWDHHVAISDRSLAEMLSLKGFDVLQQIDRFLPYTMSNGRTPPVAFVRAYVRLPLLWRIFGKQFLLVARKPG